MGSQTQWPESHLHMGVGAAAKALWPRKCWRGPGLVVTGSVPSGTSHQVESITGPLQNQASVRVGRRASGTARTTQPETDQPLPQSSATTLPRPPPPGLLIPQWGRNVSPAAPGVPKLPLIRGLHLIVPLTTQTPPLTRVLGPLGCEDWSLDSSWTRSTPAPAQLCSTRGRTRSSPWRGQCSAPGGMSGDGSISRTHSMAGGVRQEGVQGSDIC